MARKTHVLLVDDVDGSEATTTVTFGLDGVVYEIDLNDAHSEELRAALNPWVQGGKRVGGRAKRSTSTARGDAQKIRRWAAENGIEVSERGRIPREVRDAYEKAN